jgi:hypothetical protein
MGTYRAAVRSAAGDGLARAHAGTWRLGAAALVRRGDGRCR